MHWAFFYKNRINLTPDANRTRGHRSLEYVMLPVKHIHRTRFMLRLRARSTLNITNLSRISTCGEWRTSQTSRASHKVFVFQLVPHSTAYDIIIVLVKCCREVGAFATAIVVRCYGIAHTTSSSLASPSSSTSSWSLRGPPARSPARARQTYLRSLGPLRHTSYVVCVCVLQ